MPQWQVEWFVDDGWSASDLDRPGIQAALKAVSGGSCRAFVAAKLDRLSRSVLDLSSLLRQGEAEGGSLVLIDFDLGTTTPTGKLVAHIVSAVADIERDRVRERTREALAAARARSFEYSSRMRHEGSRPSSLFPLTYPAGFSQREINVRSTLRRSVSKLVGKVLLS